MLFVPPTVGATGREGQLGVVRRKEVRLRMNCVTPETWLARDTRGVDGGRGRRERTMLYKTKQTRAHTRKRCKGSKIHARLDREWDKIRVCIACSSILF